MTDESSFNQLRTELATYKREMWRIAFAVQNGSLEDVRSVHKVRDAMREIVGLSPGDVVANFSLQIMVAPINPPKPIGCIVLDGREAIGSIEFDEIRRCARRLRNLEYQPHRSRVWAKGTPPMVRGVARALCEADGFDPDATSDIEIVGDPDACHTWAGYRSAACSAIEAMREPTDEMLAAKRSVDFVADGDPDDLGEWSAAIDAALGEIR